MKSFFAFLSLTIMMSIPVISMAELSLINPELNASEPQAPAPDGWMALYETQHTAQSFMCRSESTAWMFWYDSSIYQEFTEDLKAGTKIHFGGYLAMPCDNALRRGPKSGRIMIEFYDSDTAREPMTTTVARPVLTEDNTCGEWIRAEGFAEIPTGTKRIRFLIACVDAVRGGEGAFYADDVFLEEVE